MKTYHKPMVESGVGCLCFFRGMGLHVREGDDKGRKESVAGCCGL
jgi:hypothetical protein